MGAMQLDPVQAGGLAAHRSRDVVSNKGLDLVVRHGLGAGFLIIRRALGHAITVIGLGPHAAVLKLNHRVAAVLLDTRGEAGQPGNVPIVMGAQLSRETDAAVLYRGGAGHGQAEAALGPVGQPAVLIVTEDTISGTLQVGQRGQYEAILQSGAVIEFQCIGELGGHGSSCCPDGLCLWTAGKPARKPLPVILWRPTAVWIECS